MLRESFARLEKKCKIALEYGYKLCKKCDFFYKLSEFFVRKRQKYSSKWYIFTKISLQKQNFPGILSMRRLSTQVSVEYKHTSNRIVVVLFIFCFPPKNCQRLSHFWKHKSTIEARDNFIDYRAYYLESKANDRL